MKELFEFGVFLLLLISIDYIFQFILKKVERKIIKAVIQSVRFFFAFLIIAIFIHLNETELNIQNIVLCSFAFLGCVTIIWLNHFGIITEKNISKIYRKLIFYNDETFKSYDNKDLE